MAASLEFGNGRFRTPARLLLALALLAPLAAWPAHARDRVQIVAGWRISAGPSGDGGHAVRLTRRTRSWSFDHNLEYWHGNGGVAMGSEFHQGSCASGDGSAIVPLHLGTSRRALEERLASYLRECPLPRREAAALRASLRRAWPVFLRHARRARAYMEADLDAIARHGAQP